MKVRLAVNVLENRENPGGGVGLGPGGPPITPPGPPPGTPPPPITISVPTLVNSNAVGTFGPATIVANVDVPVMP